MPREWTILPDAVQLHLAHEALRQALETVAGQAETLAGVMEEGELQDRGGPDALRLLAAVVRATGPGPAAPHGHA